MNSDAVSILFIGNSLTMFHNIPLTFELLAEAKGYVMHVEDALRGGAPLEYHAAENETLSKICSRDWDYVILQGSNYAIAFPEQHDSIIPAVAALRDTILASSSDPKVILFMDWAMKNGVRWNDVAYTFEDFQDLLIAGTKVLADNLDLLIAPIGAAFKTVVAERPDIDLYAIDLGHPSEHGSYLSACVYYAMMFQDSAAGIPVYRDLPEEEALYLQTVATETVLNDLERWNITH